MNPDAAALSAPHREPLIDALRALAILGVLIANAQSYTTAPYGSPLGLPTPADSAAAWTVHAAVAWLVQGKAYPLLAFLFGYSQAMSQARALPARLEHRRRRMRRLLLLGLLHGALLFAGDILTLYAVCGLLLLHQARARLSALRRRLRVWLLLALAVYALNVWLSWTTPRAVVAPSLDPSTLFVGVDGWPAFLALNVVAYLRAQANALLMFLPEVMTLMLAGLIAGRLQLLTRRRWRGRLVRLARLALPVGLLGSALYAVGVANSSRGGVAAQWPWLVTALPIGWLLCAGYCSAAAVAWHAGPPAALRALVPLGRYTLSLYVGLSLLAALLLSGAGRRWPAGSVELAAGAVGLWLLALAVAHGAAARGWRGPLEAWMARP